jgi:hypothetical protein
VSDPEIRPWHHPGNQQGGALAMRSACYVLFDFPATFLPVTFPGKSSLNPFFLSRFQVERMPLDLFDDVFLLHFPLEPAKGVL